MAKKDVKENKQKSHYFKDMKAELKKVIWPTPKQVLNSTIAVIVFTIIIAVIVFVLDLGFDAINTYGVTALQEKIQTSYKESHPSEDENTTSENTTTEENSSNSEASEENNSENVNVETDSTNTESQE